jgi:hypothetical protein
MLLLCMRIRGVRPYCLSAACASQMVETETDYKQSYLLLLYVADISVYTSTEGQAAKPSCCAHTDF